MHEVINIQSTQHCAGRFGFELECSLVIQDIFPLPTVIHFLSEAESLCKQ